MKKLSITILTAWTMLTASPLLADDYTVISVNEITQEMVDNHIFSTNPNMVIEFPAGSSLMFGGVVLSGQFFSSQLTDAPQTVNVLSTCYARFTPVGLAFSSDLQTWQPFFGFFGGNFGAVIVPIDGVATLIFNAELNQRVPN